MDVTDITFYYSTFWGAYPYDVIKYVIEYVAAHPEFIELFLGSFVSEESFIATLLNRSPYKEYMH